MSPEIAHTILGRSTRPATPLGGLPLVLLHGFPLDRAVWQDVAERLAPTRRVITLDLPGFGESRYAHPFSLEDQARFLRGFLREKGLTPCVMAGLSMGGYVALMYHRLFPADLAGLAVVDSKAEPDSAEARENRNRMSDIARREGTPAIVKLMLPKMLAPSPSPGLEKRLVDIMSACPAGTIAHACHAMRDRPDFRPDVATTHTPLLVITGEHDAITPPALSRFLATSARHGTYVEIPNAGHMAPLECPEAVAKALAGFAERIG
jgi:3-oxoadipate enol-lactonase